MTDTSIETEAGFFSVDVEARTVKGLLLPYGEKSRPASAAGVKTDPVFFQRGDVALPADPDIVTLNEKHDRLAPFGRGAELEDTDAGVMAAFRIARTPEGDAFMSEYTDPEKRKKLRLSAEVRHFRRDPENPERGYAELVGAARVDEGAFASAGFFSIDTETPAPTQEQDTAPATAEVTEPDAPAETQEDDVTDTPAQVPALLQASAPKKNAQPTEPTSPSGLTAGAMFAKLAQLAETKDPRLAEEIKAEAEHASAMFALNDIDATGTDGLTATMSQPQWLGELWSGRRFQRRYWPLFRSGILTGFKIDGYKFGTKPVVAEWTGNKTNVPSGPITVTPYTTAAKGLAGAHDVDRRYRDFSVAAFWEAYFRYMADSYAEESDAGAIADCLDAATVVTPGTVPTGVNAATAALVDGALAVLDYGVPTFAVVGKAAWRELLLTPKDKTVEFLSMALNLEGGQMEQFQLVPARGDDLAEDDILVGVRDAFEVLELGGSPIRVEGLDMVKGGIDPGVFGYYATVVHEDAALALVTSES